MYDIVKSVSIRIWVTNVKNHSLSPPKCTGWIDVCSIPGKIQFCTDIQKLWVGSRCQFSNMNAEAGFLVLCNEIGPEVSSVWGIFSVYLVTADVVTTVKKGIATEGTNTRSQKEAKKEKKPVVNLLLNRKTLKLPLWNRLVWFFCLFAYILVPEIDYYKSCYFSGNYNNLLLILFC